MGEPDKTQRMFSYDFVRCIAIIFVVAVHSLAFVDVTEGLNYWYYWTGEALFLTGNTLFFLLSGRFNLREQKDLGRYYIRKVRNIILPLLVFFVIRTAYNIAWGGWPGIRYCVVSFIKNTAYVFADTEYWFVFMLVGFIMAAPFLARIFNGLKESWQWAFFGLGAGWTLMRCLCSNLGFSWGWSYLFDGFILSFCLGFLIEGMANSPKRRRVFYVLAVLCLVLTVIFGHIGWSSSLYTSSPVMLVLSIGLYLGLLQIGGRIGSCKPISFVAKHSFSIYLIHMMVLIVFQHVLPSVTGLASLPFHWLMTIVILLTSLIIAAVIDRLIIDQLKKLFDVIARRLFPDHI